MRPDMIMTLLVGWWFCCFVVDGMQLSMPVRAVVNKPPGLRVSVRTIRHLDKQRVSVVYRLEYVKGGEWWALNPTEVVHFSFWDGNGRPIKGSASKLVILGEAFSEHEKKAIEVEIRIKPPAAAASLAIELGS